MISGFARRLFKVPKYISHVPRVRVTDAPFRWHYDVSTDKVYEEAIACLKKGVIQRDFVVNRPKQRANSQPVWNLCEPPQLRELMRWRERQEWQLTTVRPDDIYSEVWASYQPFHHRKSPSGICFWPDGVASCAAVLRDATHSLHEEILTDRASVVWAMSFLYLHEFVHQIVEDVVTALEFRIEKDIYLPAQAKWSGCLLMEEALANSYARSLQSTFLAKTKENTNFEAGRSHQAKYDNKPYTPDKEPIIDADVMIQALDAVMREQPAGYRDYVDFGSTIVQSFYDNLFCLIVLLYLCHEFDFNDPIGHSHFFDSQYIHYERDLSIVLDAGRIQNGLSEWAFDHVVVYWNRPSG
jgi:hypothetical protein